MDVAQHPIAPQYAVVCYLHRELAAFVESLRRELAPEQAHLRAHLTLLPPRRLQISEAEAIALTGALAERRSAIPVTLGDSLETFLPVSPTIYLPVATGAAPLCELHAALNSGGLAAPEPWAYVPHVTLANLPTPGQARSSQQSCGARWKNYRGPRHFLLDHLAFVREESSGLWRDLGRFALPSEAAAAP